MVSACLLGENCKYNGGNNRCEKVIEFLQGHEVIAVCPEVMGGLAVPRVPAEICNGKVITVEGADVDREFRHGASQALSLALDKSIDLAILQSRSPSCGVHEIYDGTFSRHLIPGEGVFAALLKEKGIKVIDKEDI